MKTVKVGLIGFGVSGKIFHAPFLSAHPGFEVLVVSSSRIDEVKASFPDASVVPDAKDVIHHPEVELVINCAPNTFHYSYSAEAMRAGKHVLIEKPFVNSVAEGKSLIEIAKSTGKLLTVFQNRRWDGDFLTIQKILANQQLGNLKQFETHFDRWRPVARAGKWREQAGVGNGAFFDLAPHLFDQLIQLFGMPEKVQADIAIQKDAFPVDDYFHVIFTYGKMRAIIHGTSFSAHTPRFQVFGDLGNYFKFGLDPQEAQLREGLSIDDPKFGFDPSNPFGNFVSLENAPVPLVTEKGNYLKFYELLYSAISTNDSSKLPVFANDALKVIHLIELSQKSSDSGMTLVPDVF